MNSLSTGIGNPTFPSNFVYQHPGGFENSRSIHPALPYPITSGTSAPRMIRGPPLSIVTDQNYYPNQTPGSPQPQAPLLNVRAPWLIPQVALLTSCRVVAAHCL
jgi:hypothetical protein